MHAAVAAVATSLGVAACRALDPAPTFEPLRGITLSTHTSGSDWASDGCASAIVAMREVGANWVAIHPYAGIRGDGTVRFRRYQATALPEHLARPLREARAQGLKLLLKPHLAYWRSPFRWRGEIDFESEQSWQRFWVSYSDWILSLARALPDVDGFVVGTELDRTLENEANWRSLIADVRAATPAPLTYAANWVTYRQVPFWDALDAIGVQAYFPIADSLTRDPEIIAAGWRRVIRELEAYSDTIGRPIVLTELGYNRSWAAPLRPWSYEVDGIEAEEVQALCLAAALGAIDGSSRIRGAFLWKWFPDPHPVGRNFQLATPRLQQAIRSVWRPGD